MISPALSNPLSNRLVRIPPLDCLRPAKTTVRLYFAKAVLLLRAIYDLQWHLAVGAVFLALFSFLSSRGIQQGSLPHPSPPVIRVIASRGLSIAFKRASLLKTAGTKTKRAPPPRPLQGTSGTPRFHVPEYNAFVPAKHLHEMKSDEAMLPARPLSNIWDNTVSPATIFD